MRTHLLTGDHQGPAARVAEALGIESVCASATPAGKLDYVRQLQAQGRRVLMVGDGVNDAPVLAAADAPVAGADAPGRCGSTTPRICRWCAGPI